MSQRLFLLLTALVLACPACTDKSKNPAADIVETKEFDLPREEIVPDPDPTFLLFEDEFAAEFQFQGQLLTALRAKEGSGLYLCQGSTRTGLTGGPTVSQEGQTSVLMYETEDGRTAHVKVGPGPEGGATVSFSVAGKTDKERLCADFSVGAGEGFYGLMERVVQGQQEYSWTAGMTEGLNLRGQDVELLIMPTVSVYSPFFVSSAGYGVFVDSDWPGTYRLGTRDDEIVSIEYEGEVLDLKVFPGPTPLEATARYSRAVGTTILPPKWVFGPWRWRDEVFHLPEFYDGTPYGGPYNSMVVEDVLMMKALGIPCTLYWVDRPWGPGPFGYDDLLWDEDRLPDPLDMISWLDGEGLKFMLWVAPWAVGEMAQEAVDKGYNVDPAFPSSPDGAELLDLTNPDAVSWWQEKLGARIKEGVVGFKLDRGEEKVPFGVMVQGEYDDGRSYREGHNAYPELYAAAVHGAFEKAGAEEFVVMPRSGWVGTSSHAVVWGGDTAPGEWGLRSAMIALLRSSVLNFPIWGSDTCGYHHMSEHEVCARWLQFSAFSPLMEVGPTDNLAPWSAPWEPSYDQELIAVWILYANLHHDLMDYTYEQAKLAHETGMPIVRPMIAAYPDMAEYLDMFEQYLYGPDILVAPIWQEGITEREVHIPEGEWVDAWTGEAVAAGKVAVDTPIHKIPIFVRAGSGIDLGDLEGRWEEALLSAGEKPDLAVLAEGAR